MNAASPLSIQQLPAPLTKAVCRERPTSRPWLTGCTEIQWAVYSHGVLRVCSLMVNASRLSSLTWDVLKLAAWQHDRGYRIVLHKSSQDVTRVRGRSQTSGSVFNVMPV